MVLHKFDSDQKEALYDIVRYEGFKEVVRDLENTCMEIEQRVFTYRLEDGDVHTLGLIKARAEGARKLFINFRDRMASLSAKDKQ